MAQTNLVDACPTSDFGRKAWLRGYESALRDLAVKIAEGGEEAAREWIDNNSTGPAREALS